MEIHVLSANSAQLFLRNKYTYFTMGGTVALRSVNKNFPESYSYRCSLGRKKIQPNLKTTFNSYCRPESFRILVFSTLILFCCIIPLKLDWYWFFIVLRSLYYLIIFFRILHEFLWVVSYLSSFSLSLFRYQN